MTPAEASMLLAVAASYDNRKADPDVAKAWSVALEGIRFVDARDAIVRHAQTSTDYLTPAHIIAEVKRIRSKRIADHPILTPPPGTEAEQRAWLGEAKRRIGGGEMVDSDAAYELKPRDLGELRQLGRGGES